MDNAQAGASLLGAKPSSSSLMPAAQSGAQFLVSDLGGGNPTSNNTTNNTTGTYNDPYAKYGGQDKYNSLVDGFNKQKSNIFGTADDAADQGARNLKGSILDFLDMYRSGQSKIDQAGVNNFLAKRQGQASILGMVGRGIRSGGVMLANKNAGDSSAAEALAQAYGDIGGREMRGVGNQFELGQRDIGLQQEDLGRQVDNYTRDYEDEKIGTVNAITAEARNQLAALDADMLNADLPDRIAIEQEKAKVKASALEKLSKYDSYLKTERGKVKAITPEEQARQAAVLQNAGTDLGEGAFNFSTEVPTQFSGSGPFASQLPIFTGRRRQEA